MVKAGMNGMGKVSVKQQRYVSPISADMNPHPLIKLEQRQSTLQSKCNEERCFTGTALWLLCFLSKLHVKANKPWFTLLDHK
jgi:hypothetical protein